MDTGELAYRQQITTRIAAAMEAAGIPAAIRAAVARGAYGMWERSGERHYPVWQMRRVGSKWGGLPLSGEIAVYDVPVLPLRGRWDPAEHIQAAYRYRA